jgi:hypothetical protein
MTGGAKHTTLILLGMVMVLTVLIAAGLPRLQFQPGLPLPKLEQRWVVSEPAGSEPATAIPVNRFFSVFFATVMVVAFVVIVVKLLRGASRRDITGFLRLMLILAVLGGLFILLILLLPGSNMGSTPVETPLPTPVPRAAVPLGQAPVSLLWLVGLSLLAAALLVGAWILSSRRAGPVRRLGLEAEKARQALLTGRDLKEVIIRCYWQMGQAVKRERGLERQDFMTTGEFERLLASAGMPQAPVHQLTRLFDSVRYGNGQPSPDDEQQALACLDAIIAFSRSSAGEA